MRIARYPPEGSSQWIEEDRVTLGGEAGNSARAFSAWGLETLLIGTVLGRDERAQWLLDELANLPHVDCSWLIAAPDANTPYCNILATPNGERTMFGRHFAGMRGQTVAELPHARVFTLDPYCGDSAFQAAQTAHAAGIPIVAMDTLNPEKIAGIADIIVTSHQEIGAGHSVDELFQTAAETARRSGATFVLTLGPDGSVAFDSNGDILHRQAAISVSAIVDATGCGDIYRAGLVCGVAQGWPLAESMAFASAAASLNLMGMGGGGHVLSLDETRKIAARGSLEA
ncbi:MAG: carbohydrate kinase family protein [Armatimonadetes bacterium]|nr:carbohydrate kinase family protein [Armatimonadota bacterium]